VPDLNARDVIRNRSVLFGFGEHLVCRDIDELGLRVDEASDQPGASDPIYFGSLACDPFHGHLLSL
jgi:hypothetical protein